MKKNYENPEMDVIRLEAITTDTLKASEDTTQSKSNIPGTSDNQKL